MLRLSQDIRYALRQWGRTPLLTLSCVLILSLGSVGTIAIWTLLEALVLRPLPVHQPAQLVAFSAVDPRNPEETGHLRASALEPFERQQRVFQSLGAYATGSALADINGQRADAGLAFVTPGYFRVLGVRPALGRLLTDEEVAAAAPLAVVTYRWWQRHGGGDPGILNRAVRLDGVPFTIVGILEPRFVGMEVGFSLDFSVPIATVRSIYKLPPEFQPPITGAVGRLRNDATLEQARTQLLTMWPAVRQATVPPDAQGDVREEYLGLVLDVTSAARGFSYMRDWYRRPLYLLGGAMLCLLAVTGINVAVLTLARAHGRSLEMAVRVAIGASGRRLLRQILTESLLLSTVATIVALPFGWWLARWLATTLWRTAEVPPIDFTLDGRVLAGVVGFAVLAGLVLAAAPAWIVYRHGSRSVQPQFGEHRATSTWSQGLMILQIGAAVILLAAAAMFARALNDLKTTNAGFDAMGVALLSLVAQPTGYVKADVAAYLPELARQVAEVPGIDLAALTIPEPVMGLAAGEAKRRVAPSPPAGVGEISATFVAVSPGFFEALQIRFSSGRDFEWRDRFDGTPVCILSASLAARLFADRRAVGEHVRLGGGKRRQHVEVVGTVGDTRLADLHESQPMFVFVPILQEPPATVRSPTIALRLSQPLNQVTPEVVRRIEALGQDFAVRPRTLQQQVDASLLRERLLVVGGRYFGGLAALLVALGLNGTLSSNVSRRTREIAVRVALGAPPRVLYGMVLKQTAALAGLGLAIGLPGAWVLTRLLRGTLAGETVNATTLLGISLLITVLSLAAAWLPARRALAVVPVRALHQE